MIRVGIECEQLEGRRFGVGHTLAQLLKTLSELSLDEREWRFALYFKKEVPDDPFLKRPIFEKHILTGRGIPASFNLFYHILLPRRYRRDRLDCFFFPSYMLPAFFRGRSVAVLTNDVYWEAYHGTLPWRYRLSYRIFCGRAARHATKIMTISEYSGAELRRFYRIAPERLVINPWGVEAIFQPLKTTPHYAERVAHITQTLGIEKRFFLSVGQAFPRRHTKETIEAFAAIAKSYPDLQYFCATTDKYNPPLLQTLVAQCNRAIGRDAIVLSPYLDREDLPYLMNATEALIYISDYEALGLPPIEAVRCGRPAIVADNPLSREVFGGAGFFVEHPEDPAAIASMMRTLLDDPAATARIVEAQTPHVSRYNWRTNAEKLLRLFTEVANAKAERSCASKLSHACACREQKQCAVS
ncbi:MAG: glycosyltransferase family 1 protein [bacterium]|nr:glycosyltransferase family 1 protein [bacterium]MDZ4285231.1 glycosyltransferase family 1 protein [Patescibacteria group bacterium]